MQLTLPFFRDAKRLLDVFRSLDYPRSKVQFIVNRYEKGGAMSPERSGKGDRPAGIQDHTEQLRPGRSVGQSRCADGQGATGQRGQQGAAGDRARADAGRTAGGRGRVGLCARSRRAKCTRSTESQRSKPREVQRVIERATRSCQRSRPAPGLGPAHGAARRSCLSGSEEPLHKVLLDRIDLEAMEGLTPERLRDELRDAGRDACSIEENVVVNAVERRSLVRDIQHEMLGLGPLEPLLADPTISDILVNSSQPGLRRAARPARADRRHLHRRHAPAADHRQDRLAGRPPHRRIEPDGRRAPAGRLARQRDHSAAGAGRPDAVDPPLLGRCR